MATRYIRHLATILVLSSCLSTAGSNAPKPWVTSLDVAGNTRLRLRWIHQYEGYETVTRIDAIRGGKVVKTFHVSGQPVINKAKTLMALPDCWHGGCESKIRVLDLVALTELLPIQFDREWFFEVAWEDERRLRVVLGATNEKEKTEVRCFTIRNPQPPNKPVEPTVCASSSAPRR